VVEAAGSNPVTQTKEALENGIKMPFSRAFLLPKSHLLTIFLLFSNQLLTQDFLTTPDFLEVEGST
jgi:hypothetical protein